MIGWNIFILRNNAVNLLDEVCKAWTGTVKWGQLIPETILAVKEVSLFCPSCEGGTMIGGS
jgi:hypothetical protein